MHFTFSLTNKPKHKSRKEKKYITKQTSDFKINCRVDRVYYYEIGFVFVFVFVVGFGFGFIYRIGDDHKTPTTNLPERQGWWAELEVKVDLLSTLYSIEIRFQVRVRVQSLHKSAAISVLHFKSFAFHSFIVRGTTKTITKEESNINITFSLLLASLLICPSPDPPLSLTRTIMSIFKP